MLYSSCFTADKTLPELLSVLPDVLQYKSEIRTYAVSQEQGIDSDTTFEEAFQQFPESLQLEEGYCYVLQT